MVVMQLNVSAYTTVCMLQVRWNESDTEVLTRRYGFLDLVTELRDDIGVHWNCLHLDYLLMWSKTSSMFSDSMWLYYIISFTFVYIAIMSNLGAVSRFLNQISLTTRISLE